MTEVDFVPSRLLEYNIYNQDCWKSSNLSIQYVSVHEYHQRPRVLRSQNEALFYMDVHASVGLVSASKMRSDF